MTELSSLAGRRVLVTRERPGELAVMLARRGAVVVHVPLIAVADPEDGGLRLERELDGLWRYDWLVVTSAPGAERVGAAAQRCPDVKLAAVGTATARTLVATSARSVDVVPGVQRAEALAAELIRVAGDPPCRFLVAQADRATDVLVETLRNAGHDVTAVVAYRTVLREPDVDAIAGAEALVLASGSAARSWVESVGPSGPGVIVAIGPTTATVARELGLKVDGVAADHTIDGLVTELERHFPSPAAI